MKVRPKQEFINKLASKHAAEGDVFDIIGHIGDETIDTDYEYVKHCKYCGFGYIRLKGSKEYFCDKDCEEKYRKWNNKWKKLQKQNYNRFVKLNNSGRPKKSRENMSKIMKDKWENDEVYRNKLLARLKKMNDKRKTIWPELVSYDIPSLKIIRQHEIVRRDPKRPELMQIKCGFVGCENWVNPRKGSYQKRLGTIKGHKTKKKTKFLCEKCLQERKYLNTPERERKRKIKRERNRLKQIEREKLLRRQRLLRNKKKCAVLHRKEVRKINNGFRFLEKIKGGYGKRLKRIKEVRKLKKERPEEYKRQLTKKVRIRREELKIKDPKKFKLKKLFYYSKARSKEKKLEHTITYEWLVNECHNNICAATGRTFDYDPNYYRNPYGPSIDRSDISKGYTPENCRLVIWAYNCGKAHYTDKDLYKMCKAFIKKNTKARTYENTDE